MKSRQSSIQFLQPNVLFELADDATGPKYNDLKVGRNRRGSVTVVFMLSFSEIRRSLRNALVLSNAINGSKGNLRLLARNKSLEQWFSELARGLTCPCKPLSHDNGHNRTITPGTFTGLGKGRYGYR